MKHTLRYCFILLALATTGLFAQAATDPVDTSSPQGQHKSVKVAKGKKAKGTKAAHKKHRKHKKKSAK